MGRATSLVLTAVVIVLALGCGRRSAALAAASAAGPVASPTCVKPSHEMRVLHPARITTVAPALSRPAASLVARPAAVATAKHLIPLGRMKPWSERCPPSAPAT